MDKWFAISLNPQIVFYSFVSCFVCKGDTDQKRVFCFGHKTQATRDALFVGSAALLADKKVDKTNEFYPP